MDRRGDERSAYFSGSPDSAMTASAVPGTPAALQSRGITAPWVVSRLRISAPSVVSRSTMPGPSGVPVMRYGSGLICLVSSWLLSRPGGEDPSRAGEGASAVADQQVVDQQHV